MRARHCKIVATIGPASNSPSMLRLIFDAGVDVFRLNYSHADYEKTAKVVEAIRAIEAQSNRPIAIFADLQGPKIRTGILAGDELALKYGAEYRLVMAKETSEADIIPIPHPEIFEAIEVGDILKLDDGKLQITITQKTGEHVIARADTPGPLKNRKGINLPGRHLPISALTEKDRADLDHALSLNVDYIALSFVQRPEDILEARALIGDQAKIISKIEKPSAVESLEDIVQLSDALMVARGDLGVELPPEEVPLIQRRIIRACRSAGKPVIVATHMLESMVESIAPTRAEASDVSTAVLQGADAVMLSAETAVGRHPPTAVAIMDRIIKASERDPNATGRQIQTDPNAEHTTADAITQSARHIAEVLECRLVVAYTKTGSTAQRLSRDRPACGILAATPQPLVARQLALHWGVAPAITEDVSHFHEMLAKADRLAQDYGAEKGERIIIIAGYPFGRPGKTNSLKISRVGALEG